MCESVRAWVCACMCVRACVCACVCVCAGGGGGQGLGEIIVFSVTFRPHHQRARRRNRHPRCASDVRFLRQWPWSNNVSRQRVHTSRVSTLRTTSHRQVATLTCPGAKLHLYPPGPHQTDNSGDRPHWTVFPYSLALNSILYPPRPHQTDNSYIGLYFLPPSR